MAAKTYRFRYSADNKDFEVEGDRAFVLAMIKRFGPGGGDTPDPSPLPRYKGKAGRGVPLPEQPAAKGVSLREFISPLNLKKHTDIVLAFGYFLEKYRGSSSFTSTDINNCYYEAKMESSNTSQMIIQNIKRGYLMEARGKVKEERGARKLFTLTRTGEEHLQKALASGKDE